MRIPQGPGLSLRDTDPEGSDRMYNIAEGEIPCIRFILVHIACHALEFDDTFFCHGGQNIALDQPDLIWRPRLVVNSTGTTNMD
jgi:hypothetical protein